MLLIVNRHIEKTYNGNLNLKKKKKEKRWKNSPERKVLKVDYSAIPQDRCNELPAC